MRTNEIGRDATKVWRLMDNSRRLSYDELKRASGLSDRQLNAAIGWLARENKIEIDWDAALKSDVYHHPHFDQFF